MAPGKTRASARSTPRTECPFTGKPVEYKKLLIGGHERCMIVGDGWSSRIFEDQSKAEIWFSHESGLPPLFASQQTMKVKRVDKVEDPVADLKPNRDAIAHALGLDKK